jgi:hypothetical protein
VRGQCIRLEINPLTFETRESDRQPGAHADHVDISSPPLSADWNFMPIGFGIGNKRWTRLRR